MNFALILFLLLVITGAITLADWLFFSRRRARTPRSRGGSSTGRASSR